MLDESGLQRALTTLGEVLAGRGLHYELVAAGGSGLLLLGVSTRPTKDLDVVALVQHGTYVRADPLPPPLVEAIKDVAANLNLPDDWLNPGPTSLLDLGLPPGFEQRALRRSFGGLDLLLASREDQIFFKLFATADQGLDSKHARDLARLDPSEEEIEAAARWALTHDPSPGFRRVLTTTLAELGVENGPDEI